MYYDLLDLRPPLSILLYVKGMVYKKDLSQL
jgi:hypothetical protein